MNVVALIQARDAGERLPGKVLMPIGKQNMLERVYYRTALGLGTSMNRTVVVATTENSSEIINFCTTRKFAYAVGSEDDVLHRYFAAATVMGADVIVRITADCPLLDPKRIDWPLRMVMDNNYAWAEDVLVDGSEIQVCTYNFLKALHKQGGEWERQHVFPKTLAMAAKVPGYMRHQVARLVLPAVPPGLPKKLSVDTQEELDFVREIYAGVGKDIFGLKEVGQWLANSKR